jgi:hypothetical protein
LILAVVRGFKRSVYDNALVPIALANKLVSLSDFPSARILEAFARGAMLRSSEALRIGRTSRRS